MYLNGGHISIDSASVFQDPAEHVYTAGAGENYWEDLALNGIR
jgi:hypothetical protein